MPAGISNDDEACPPNRTSPISKQAVRRPVIKCRKSCFCRPTAMNHSDDSSTDRQPLNDWSTPDEDTDPSSSDTDVSEGNNGLTPEELKRRKQKSRDQRRQRLSNIERDQRHNPYQQGHNSSHSPYQRAANSSSVILIVAFCSGVLALIALSQQQCGEQYQDQAQQPPSDLPGNAVPADEHGSDEQDSSPR